MTFMSKIKIVQHEDSVLRQIAKEVPVEDIGAPKIKKIIEDMKSAMDATYDGVAIAAPQIGISLRIFMISPKAFLKEGENFNEKELSEKEHPVFINPRIIKLSSKTTRLDEGCLSVRGIFGKVRRAEKATIEAYNENGKKFTRGASGLIAEIFQHEIEHLNGVLFTDTATDLYQLTTEEKVKNEK